MSLEPELQPNFFKNLKTKMHKILKNDLLLDDREIEWKSYILVKISDFCQIFTKMRDFHEKGQATIITPIRPISESDKCQLRGRWGAV